MSKKVDFIDMSKKYYLISMGCARETRLLQN